MIGIGLSTYNRKELSLQAVDALWRYLPEDGVLVVGDDCSTDGTTEAINRWAVENKVDDRFGRAYAGSGNPPLRNGIAGNKSNILTGILEFNEGVTDVILVEDDVIPTAANWWEAFTVTAKRNAEGHLLWLPEFKNPVATIPTQKYGPTKCTTGETPYQIEWKRHCSGMVMYFRAELLEEVGNFDRKFGTYGWEHNEMSDRCLVAQAHAPEMYPHCSAADGLLRSLDLETEQKGGSAPSTVGSLEARARLAEQGRKHYEERLSFYRRAHERMPSAADADAWRRGRYFRT